MAEWKKIKNLKPGDTVKLSSGETVKIRGIETLTHKVLRVNFSDGSYDIGSPSEEWFVNEGSERIAQEEAE